MMQRKNTKPTKTKKLLLTWVDESKKLPLVTSIPKSKLFPLQYDETWWDEESDAEMSIPLGLNYDQERTRTNSVSKNFLRKNSVTISKKSPSGSLSQPQTVLVEGHLSGE